MSSASVVHNNASCQSSSLAAFSSPSFVTTSREEVPRPGIVKLTKSKFEQQITSLEKGSNKQEHWSMTAPNYKESPASVLHSTDRTASCASRMAGGNKEHNDRTEDDHHHKIPNIQQQVDYGRGSSSVAVASRSIDGIIDSPVTGAVSLSSIEGAATSPIVASSACTLTR